MKKFLTILSALAVAGSSAFATVAEDKPKAASGVGVMKSGNTVKVFYRATKKGNVKVTIQNSANEVVYEETIRHIDNFMRPYDVSTLSPGEYTITLEGEDGKQVEAVTIARPKQTRLMGVTKVAAKGKYLLRVANRGSDVLQIRIFNANRELLYSGQETITGDFAKLYDLSDVPEGAIFEVKSESGDVTTLSASK